MKAQHFERWKDTSHAFKLVETRGRIDYLNPHRQLNYRNGVCGSPRPDVYVSSENSLDNPDVNVWTLASHRRDTIIS